MELISYLNGEIERKEKEKEKEIKLLKSLFEDIEGKENFSKVWHTLVKCDVNNDEFAKDLVSFYFGVDRDKVNITPGYVKFKLDYVSVGLYFGNVIFSPNIVQKDISSKIVVSIDVPYNWSNLIEDKKAFKKTENYIFCEEYIELCKRNASLSEKLDLRYDGISKYRQYLNYFLRGRKEDKKYNRDINYYQQYIDKENQKYSEYCEQWKKTTADALIQFLEFYHSIYPILQENLIPYYCNIKYNVKFDDIVKKLKEIGEIV